MGRYLLGTNAASSPRTTQVKVDSLLYAGDNFSRAQHIFAIHSSTGLGSG